MTVKVEEPPPKGGNGLLYIDLGVVNLATIWFKGLKQPIAFSQNSSIRLVVLDKKDSQRAEQIG